MTTKLSVDELLDQIGSLTLLEAADLKSKMEEKFGVTAAAPVGMAVMPGAGAAGGDAAEEQTEFDAVLTSFGDKKINVLKAVREITGLGLKEAKEVVDNVPKAIKEKTTKEDAEEIKKKIEEAGGKVEIK